MANTVAKDIWVPQRPAPRQATQSPIRSGLNLRKASQLPKRCSSCQRLCRLLLCIPPVAVAVIICIAVTSLASIKLGQNGSQDMYISVL